MYAWFAYDYEPNLDEQNGGHIAIPDTLDYPLDSVGPSADETVAVPVVYHITDTVADNQLVQPAVAFRLNHWPLWLATITVAPITVNLLIDGAAVADAAVAIADDAERCCWIGADAVAVAVATTDGVVIVCVTMMRTMAFVDDDDVVLYH